MENRAEVYIIEDNPKKTFKLGIDNIKHYAWDDIDKDLGDKSWIIPRRTDCIRSYGFLKAYKDGCDVIISLDDDCYPTQQPLIQDHINNLQSQTEWFDTINLNNITPRGMPYVIENKCKVKLSVGYWVGVPDLDGVMQLNNIDFKTTLRDFSSPIPIGMNYSMCGMNIAFRREITPIMYQLLMGMDKYGIDRFGDIWSGLFSKKILDHLGKYVFFGKPCIEHIRASDPYVNMEKERQGKEINESLWECINKIQLTRNDYISCYLELSDKLPDVFHSKDYYILLKRAMQIWCSLF